MDVGSTSDAAGAGGGFAALMVAANPSLIPEQMKAAMIAGVDSIPNMQGQLVSNVSHTLLLTTRLNLDSLSTQEASQPHPEKV